MCEPSTLEFEGMRILVVEDDYHVATSLEQTLVRLGCEVVGPTATADEACELVKHEVIDAAILDVRLAPGTSVPVATALRSRECPFVFVTGFADLGMLPEDLRGHRVLHKPVETETLRGAVREMVSERPRA
jgi:DNA-binding NtrC family response regulator